MDFSRCAACRERFRRCPQVPGQTYCSEPKCQRVRRQRTQQEKLRRDPDYKDNQSDAQKTWIGNNPGYWREYRRTHQEYCDRNRALQRERNSRRKANLIAKMDTSAPISPVPSGIYRLIPVTAEVAKKDVWTVEIIFLSSTYDPSDGDCKEGLDG